ncbi:MAG: 6-phosphogluconolactonase [Deltaproteobacteria bacterium]|nr:6-phosphogluconolactonase [Deltaproteobacteria bacterium]
MFTVIITRDFDHMSEVAARLVIDDIGKEAGKKDGYVLGLATGNSPTGLYKHLAKAANAGQFDGAKIETFNLDEYVGLPGENAQQRVLHPESYSYFMVQEFFGLLQSKFKESNVPWGTLIDQEILTAELETHPEDWEEQGADKGKAIVIKAAAQSEYLRWIRTDILDAYAAKIRKKGGVDLHIIGVGGRGHVAFHESGIPFEGNEMLLVRLDENTVANALEDGHFAERKESPQYAISMGAELVYRAQTVILLANGGRKAGPVAESLLKDPSPLVPISYGQLFSGNGGEMIYVIDREAAAHIIDHIDELERRNIHVEDIGDTEAMQRVEDLQFFRNPESCLLG